MNVHIKIPTGYMTRGNLRIYTQLQKYFPEEFKEVSYEDADLVVFFVCGRKEHLEKETRRLGKPYAAIQVALQSTRNPNPEDWLSIWNDAKLVWSYYNLPITNNFYHAPLAADTQIFYPEDVQKNQLILLNGNTVRDESLNEIKKAIELVGESYIHADNFTDDELRTAYNRCKYVSGLRRKDGFEMPAVEGLFCGSRPILYDTPNYRQWFDGLAEFIPEDTPEKVTENLVNLFRQPYKKVTELEREETMKRFNWEKITAEFWRRCK